ncbi:MAG: efflux RND transporter permease subunit [Myxococcales bacterium]|nr:efflux RND transporter permease subunit [Myxococcales bacterium]
MYLILASQFESFIRTPLTIMLTLALGLVGAFTGCSSRSAPWRWGDDRHHPAHGLVTKNAILLLDRAACVCVSTATRRLEAILAAGPRSASGPSS